MIKTTVSALVLAGALSVAAEPANAPEPAHPRLGEAAPAFSLPTTDGAKVVSLSDFEGSFLVLHFGASW